MVRVVEVGPRDGLQNETNFVPTGEKVRLIEALGRTGLQYIEITSFVSPKWIPSLADGSLVAQSVKLPPHIHCSALVPNLKGYEAARQAGINEIALFLSATETHCKKNINKTIAEAFAQLAQVVEVAKKDKVWMRGYLSVVFVCPYEGKVNPDRVLPLIHRLLEIGINEISLGDTIGAATPKDVHELLKLLKDDIIKTQLALHFHDTYGIALANVVAGLHEGITIFDASIGGIGGCPYAPGAAGNLATEDLVYMLHGMGIKTGIDFDKLIDCGEFAQSLVGRQLPGRCLQAHLAARKLQQKQVQ